MQVLAGEGSPQIVFPWSSGTFI